MSGKRTTKAAETAAALGDLYDVIAALAARVEALEAALVDVDAYQKAMVGVIVRGCRTEKLRA